MKKFIPIFMVALGVVNSCCAADAGSDCDKHDANGIQKGIFIQGYDSGRRVVGAGRAYFFSGPDQACKEKKLFIIPGDEVTAYKEYGDYTLVMFINLKEAGDTEGWILTSRLEETGTGNSPR